MVGRFMTSDLKKTFKVLDPSWKFRGVCLWDELNKLEMRIAFNQLSQAQLNFIENAVNHIDNLVDEVWEHNEVAYVLLRYLEKMDDGK